MTMFHFDKTEKSSSLNSKLNSKVEMKVYKSRQNGGNSGIEFYGIGKDYIDVVFYGTSERYRYTQDYLGGEDNLIAAKKAAIKGKGLNSILNKIKQINSIKSMLT